MIESGEQAVSLAEHLLDQNRLEPAVVVTIATGEAAPFVNPDDLTDEVAELAVVYVLPAGYASWEFARQLPELTQVYGGASRVYPVGSSWQTNPRQSPLRFAYSAADGSRVLDSLVDDVMAMAHDAGITRRQQAADTRAASGRVSGMIGNRALVEVEGGGIWPATVVPGAVFPGVDIDNLVRKGMSVKGVLDVEHNRLDIASAALSWVQALDSLQLGHLTPARVDSVEKGHIKVSLHPDLRVVVQAFDVVGPGGDDLRRFFTRHETVVVEVLAVGGAEQKDWRLRVRDDIEDDQVSAACALLPGGPPWLTWPPVLDAKPELPQALPEPSPLEASIEEGLELAQLRADVERLNAQLSARYLEIQCLKTTARQLRSSSEQAKGRARQAEKDLDAFSATAYSRDAVLFEGEEEQFRFEVQQAWAYRTTPADKREYVIAAYSFGPDFFQTLISVSGISRNKVVEVVAEVVSGRAWESAGREAHQLRQSRAGDAPYVVGPSGETCWRIALQVGTPSARRLHFWRDSVGNYQLSSVRLHDDFRP